MKKIILTISLLFTLFLNAQITNDTNTVGLLYTQPEKVSEGYLLFAPFGVNDVFLIDNCGLVVNDWTFENPTIYSGCYLLEDGSVLKLNGEYNYYSYAESESCIEHRSWENELIWQYCLEIEDGFIHSDVHILPNGNILAIILETYTVQEGILSGANPSRVGNDFQLETIVEFKPIGIDSTEIVWKWRLFDHLVQDYDESKNNYGVVAENQRKYNINSDDSGYNHYNSIDYNEALDQIVFSSWNDHEIYIIDHSTTTEEAAGSTGGRYGFGGDFLFRWGNPKNYNVEAAQKLLGQHNPRWIPNDYQQFGGMLSIFNNRYGELNLPLGGLPLAGDKSAVVVINPDADGDGIYEMEEGKFLPATYKFVLPNENVRGGDMYSEIMSGAFVQPNGNIVTCEAVKGRFMEFDTLGNLLWQYQCPVDYENFIEQGSRGINGAYKVEKYSSNYPGLAGRDLCGIKIIENENEVSEACVKLKLPKMAFLENIDGAEVDFSLVAEGYDELIWNFGDDNSSTEENPTHIYESPGEYEACITGINYCYGESTYCEKILIEVTSVSSLEENSAVLTTNLITDQLNFTNQKIEVKGIYNMSGELITQSSHKELKSSIDVSNFSSGIYFLVYKNFNQKTFSKVKFLKI